MAQPSQTDLTPPFDPTAYPSISGAQLLQLVAGLTPYLDKGFVVTTTDVATVPQVPDAVNTTKWQDYLWRRVSATTTDIYIWNPGAAADPTYLNWQSISTAASTIGAGTIVNSMIADNTIQDAKIANLSYSKLIGSPTSLAPSGAASGDLTGTYPSPSVGAGAITTSKIANNAITHAQLGAQAVQPTTDILPSGAAFNMLRTNAGATALEYFAPAATLVASSALETNLAANPLKMIRSNAAGNGYEYAGVGGSILQSILYRSTATFTTATNLAINTAPTTSNTALVTLFGASGVISFTPLSATSKLFIDVILQMSNSAQTGVAGFLFNGTAAVAGGFNSIYVATAITNVAFSYLMTSGTTGILTFSVYVSGASGTTYINEQSTGAAYGGGILSSSVKITEIL